MWQCRTSCLISRPPCGCLWHEYTETGTCHKFPSCHITRIQYPPRLQVVCKCPLIYIHLIHVIQMYIYWPCSKEVKHLVSSAHPSVWFCESYIVHHLVSTGLCCALPTCVVHHGAQWEPLFLRSIFVVDNKHTNQGSQYSSIPTYTLVVYNVALYRLGGAHWRFCMFVINFFDGVQCSQSPCPHSQACKSEINTHVYFVGFL